MEQMNLNYETSLSKLKMIISQEIDPELALKNADVYKNIKKEWLDIFRKVFKNSKIKSLPADLFILIDKEFEFLLKEILSDSEAHTGVLKFGRKPKMHFINSESVINLCNYKTKVEKDPIISLSASFVEIIE
jgi:hypothetical protein